MPWCRWYLKGAIYRLFLRRKPINFARVGSAVFCLPSMFPSFSCLVKVYGEREQSTEERLRDKNKRRAAYHRFYTNMKRGHAQNYHPACTTSLLHRREQLIGPDEAALMFFKLLIRKHGLHLLCKFA